MGIVRGNHAAQLVAAAFALASGTVRSQEAIPADIGVTLMASPSAGLVTGQPIDITVTVTNHGPEPATFLVLQSSTFVTQFGGFVTNPSECYLYETVVDAFPTPYYYINWTVANVLGDPGSSAFNAGDVLTCHFQMALTQQAPAVVSFSFGVSSYFTDINPANDNATVVLRRAVTQIPALSTPTLLLLIALLLAVASPNLLPQHRKRAIAPGP